MTTILPFNKKKYWQNLCSVFWPFHDLPWLAEKEVVHFDLDGPRAFAKSVGMIFLSHRNLNIPSSLNNPVLASKVVGKTEREKLKFQSWLTNDNQFYCAATWTIIFMSASSLCEQKHTLACPFSECCGFLQPFYHAIHFHPVERIATRSMPHTKRLANVEAIPFPTSKLFQSTAFSNSPPHKLTFSLVRKWDIQPQGRTVSS